ncbi:MAG: putative porin [Ignavibacteria bacterium]|nr:putative porin [Ignavibacteria bacterium]
MKQFFSISFFLLVFLYSNSYSNSQLQKFDISQISDTVKVDTSIRIDTLAILDSLRKALLGDSVITIKSLRIKNPFTEHTLKPINLLTDNFYDVYNQINFLPNSFVRDLGSPSHLSEVILQGNGWRKSSYFIDGLNLNDPFTNTYDLQELRCEELQSIDLITNTRAFLYGRTNEKVSVIFNSKEFYSVQPYSRIKYIESQYNNLYLDGIFNVNVHRRINLDLGVKKHSAPGRFRNSEFDIWAGKIKLTHFLSNAINWNLAYRYIKSLYRFNEGVDVANIVLRPNENLEDVLYDEQKAPVQNSDANQTSSKHTLNLQFRGKFFDDSLSLSKADFYFIQHLREFRQGEVDTRLTKIENNHWTKLFGAKLQQNFNLGNNKFEFTANLERKIIESPFVHDKLIRNNFQSYLLWEYQISDLIVPAVYIKYLNYGKRSSINFGGDITFYPSQNFSGYFGASYYTFYPSVDQSYYNRDSIIEGRTLNLYSKLTYQNDFLKLSIDYFFYQNKATEYLKRSILFPYSLEEINGINLIPELKSLQHGGSLSGEIKFWKTITNLSVSIIRTSEDDYATLYQPRYKINLGIYFKDRLFNNSLDLTAGLRFNYFTSYYGLGFAGEKIYYVNSKIIEGVEKNYSQIKIPSNYRLDVFASGIIKESATVYIAIENITNNKFYLEPYYPINDIGLRFGIAWEFLD